jgi:TolA-binding protein
MATSRLEFRWSIKFGLAVLLVPRALGLAGQAPDSRAQYQAGVAAFESGDLEKAERAFRAALRDRPEFVEARQNLAVTLGRV